MCFFDSALESVYFLIDGLAGEVVFHIGALLGYHTKHFLYSAAGNAYLLHEAVVGVYAALNSDGEVGGAHVLAVGGVCGHHFLHHDFAALAIVALIGLYGECEICAFIGAQGSVCEVDTSDLIGIAELGVGECLAVGCVRAYAAEHRVFFDRQSLGQNECGLHAVDIAVGRVVEAQGLFLTRIDENACRLYRESDLDIIEFRADIKGVLMDFLCAVGSRENDVVYADSAECAGSCGAFNFYRNFEQYTVLAFDGQVLHVENQHAACRFIESKAVVVEAVLILDHIAVKLKEVGKENVELHSGDILV